MGRGLNDSPTPTGRATLKDVARLANVDPSLVSRIVNNDPKANCSAATRVRILKAVETLGYQANAAARGLKMARTLTIGLLLPDLTNPMYASIISGVEARCLELGYGIILGDHAEGNSEKTFTGLLEQGRVDGLLVASGILPDSFLRKVIVNRSRPIVLVNRRAKGVNSSVIVNDELGAALAVEHLVGIGSKSIAGIFGPKYIDTAKRRRVGFERACQELGVSPIVLDRKLWDMRAGYEAGIELFSLKQQPDAVFASTLLMGIGLLRAAAEMGVAIPDRTSVVAMHDSEIADYLSPPLTTISMPTGEMGRQAVDLLVDLMEGKAPRHVMVDHVPNLIIRASTKR